MTRIGTLLLFLLVPVQAAPAADKPSKRSPREALQAFNDLIGDWRATGTPEGSREKRQRDFWTESVSWSWQFKGDDAWLTAVFTKGKYFRSGELRYLPSKGAYQLALATPAKEKLTFTGKLDDGRLTLNRTDDKSKEDQRLVLTLLHANRFLYRYEVKSAKQSAYTRLYQVGATKEGEPFAGGDGKPECVVSGGLGTRTVSYKGKTYYVCCSGCADAFKEDPEKYIKEYEAKKAKK